MVRTTRILNEWTEGAAPGASICMMHRNARANQNRKGWWQPQCGRHLLGAADLESVAAVVATRGIRFQCVIIVDSTVKAAPVCSFSSNRVNSVCVEMRLIRFTLSHASRFKIA